MKTLQTIIGLDSKLGGPSTCTYDLVHAMREVGSAIDLLTVTVTDPTDKMIGCGEDWIKVVRKDYKTPFAISRNLRDFLRKTNYDIYHANTLWLYQSHITCKTARIKGKPYIISPHGMLYHDALKRSAWKKQLMLALCFSEDISKANALHATCITEMEHIRDFGYSGPIAVIPNPISVPNNINEILKSTPKKNRVGYLGRLHPYKRPDALIKAWAKVKSAGWELVFMGKGEPQYEEYLHHLCQELSLNNVIFKGQIENKQKYEELATCKTVCCPSVSENFGMSVAESLLCHTPVICTKTAPWEDLVTYNCGWWIDNSIDSIANQIQQVFKLDNTEIIRMGERGSALINDKYCAKKIAHDMQALYDWIINKEEKPSFVYE